MVQIRLTNEPSLVFVSLTISLLVALTGHADPNPSLTQDVAIPISTRICLPIIISLSKLFRNKRTENQSSQILFVVGLEKLMQETDLGFLNIIITVQCPPSLPERKLTMMAAAKAYSLGETEEYILDVRTPSDST
jgi:hypothetical protein